MEPCYYPRLIEHHHLDAPYYWLRPITWLEEASYMKKSHRSHGSTFSCNRPALAGYVVFIYMDPSVFVQSIGEIPSVGH
jgi:hypothetical protein